MEEATIAQIAVTLMFVSRLFHLDQSAGIFPGRQAWPPEEASQCEELPREFPRLPCSALAPALVGSEYLLILGDEDLCNQAADCRANTAIFGVAAFFFFAIDRIGRRTGIVLGDQRFI